MRNQRLCLARSRSGDNGNPSLLRADSALLPGVQAVRHRPGNIRLRHRRLRFFRLTAVLPGTPAKAFALPRSGSLRSRGFVFSRCQQREEIQLAVRVLQF